MILQLGKNSHWPDECLTFKEAVGFWFVCKTHMAGLSSSHLIKANTLVWTPFICLFLHLNPEFYAFFNRNALDYPTETFNILLFL